MEFVLEDSIVLLESTPAVLNALLRPLPAAWTTASEGQGGWSLLDVIAHMAHCEASDWMPRVRTILRFGESQTFAPLDREGFRASSQDKPLVALLDEFAERRAESLAALRALRLEPFHLELRGLHPAFGPVSLSQLLATWTTHDLTHLHQISRIMASHYREAVGPWSAYLGVLQCNGHSAS